MFFSEEKPAVPLEAASPDTASQTTAGFGSLDGVKVLEKTENSVTLEFLIPAESPYFDGHFRGFPILPAVAQVDIAVRFAAGHFGTGVDILEIKRIKFSNRVIPDVPYHLRLEKSERTLLFKFISIAGETVYSSGTLLMRENSSSEKNS